MIDHLPCSIITSDIQAKIRDRKSLKLWGGSGIRIRVENQWRVWSEENSEDLKYEDNSAEYDPDAEDAVESGASEDNDVKENGQDRNSEETSENVDE